MNEPLDIKVVSSYHQLSECAFRLRVYTFLSGSTLFVCGAMKERVEVRKQSAWAQTAFFSCREASGKGLK